MQKSLPFMSCLIVILAALSLGMARHGQYDEEARAAERREREMRKAQKQSVNPVKEMASGLKQATVDSTGSLISETASESANGAPVLGTVEGARMGSGRAVDNAVKGAFKVATLGYGNAEDVKVQEPEDNSGEPTKFSISLPGT